MTNKRTYEVVKTDENDWAIIYEVDGDMVPIAMSIRSESVAWDMARHLNITRNRPSQTFRAKHPDANLVITAGKGFHIRFANGRGASVQWGTGNYCDRQDFIRGRDFFEVQLKDERMRKIYAEFDGPANVYYEQMFADWGSDNAEISPSYSDTEEGWVSPDKIVDFLHYLSKLPALENGKEPVDVDKVISKLIEGTTDEDLIDGVSVWKKVDKDCRPRVHEWRNYLDEKILEIWEDLTPRERALCFSFCREQADHEEWD